MPKNDLVTASEIEMAYSESTNQLGWRFLSSPVDVLESANVAFIGLNPGGREDVREHPRFATEGESAFISEQWNNAPAGQSRLQVQVCGLFKRLDIEPKKVLAGNLVPFRSPSWAALNDRKEALAFGSDLWERILARAQPDIVIGMGRVVTKHLARILQTDAETRVSVGWGRVAGTRAYFGDGLLVGLPHLSRFPIVGREKSKQGLSQLFGSAWKECL